MARRVAEEMDTEVGADVGYSVRFEERTSSMTRIVYLTGGHQSFDNAGCDAPSV